jgi:hypothetical protein
LHADLSLLVVVLIGFDGFKKESDNVARGLADDLHLDLRAFVRKRLSGHRDDVSFRLSDVDRDRIDFLIGHNFVSLSPVLAQVPLPIGQTRRVCP